MQSACTPRNERSPPCRQETGPTTSHPSTVLPPTTCARVLPCPPINKHMARKKKSTVPFPMFEVQANAVAAAISGRASFPPLAEREQWLRDEEERLRERGVDPASRGAHVLQSRQWEYLRRLLRLARGPGVLERGPGVATDDDDGRATSVDPGGGGDDGGLGLEALLKVLRLREAVYNDSGDNRPPMPGGPDDYRRREYDVDWENGTFSVSLAERKANGEGPSAT